MKTITLKWPATCADCGADLPVGTRARYYGRGRVYGIECHEQNPRQNGRRAKRNGNGAARANRKPTVDYAAILAEAKDAGMAALERKRDAMIADVNAGRAGYVIKDGFTKEPVGFLPGLCGFAWVRVKPVNKGNGARLWRWLQKQYPPADTGKPYPFKNHYFDGWGKDNYGGGITHWIHEGGQSVDAKKAYARAMAHVLCSHDIPATSGSRLD